MSPFRIVLATSALSLAANAGLAAQEAPPIVSIERRALIAADLAAAPITRVELRSRTVVLRSTRLVGDSLSGLMKTAGASRNEALTPFSVHLNDIGRLERRNLRKSLGWGFAIGALIGFSHAQTQQAKDKLRASTTRSDAYYTQQNLVFGLGGGAVGLGIGSLFPAWELIHQRRW